MAAREALKRGGAALFGRVPTLAASELRVAQEAVETLDPFGARHASRQIVKQRMKSVGNIAKITKAMKMVAASRLRGTQTLMEKSRGIAQPIVKLFGETPGLSVAKTVVVPLTSDKGLCGGINTTVVKYTKIVDKLAAEDGATSSLYIVGEKGRAQLVRGEIVNRVNGVTVDAFKPKDGFTFSSASLIADSIAKLNADKTQVIFNRFQSVISFKPTVATILSPAAVEKRAEEEGGLAFDMYEVEGPDRGELLLDLSEFQLAATLYNAMLENATSELGSRMQSMENSTKNAQDMLARLTLFYNRTRQAAITTELIEIISGAAALEG